MRLSKILATLTFIALSTPSWADQMFEPDMCRNDTKACKALAVEMVKLDFENLIRRELDSRPQNSFLCPPDNPQCCPPHLAPLCVQQQKEVVLQSSKKFDKSLDDFFCTVNGGSWNPLTESCGEGGDLVVAPWEPPFPPGKACNCNEKPNSIGKCVPKKLCHIGNKTVPCVQTCLIDPPKVAKLRTNLGRNIADRKIQLDAANQVREELKLAINILDDQISELKRKSKAN